MNMNFYKKIFKDSDNIDDTVYQKFLVKELILRDYLAIERTMLSNEVTFMGYIRTSLTVLIVGVTIIHFSSKTYSNFLGIVTASIGFVIFIFGWVRTSKMKKKINLLRRKKEIQFDKVE